MTERLSVLLREEADGLDVPSPSTAAILERGHGLRRRRRWTQAATGALVAAVVVAGGATGAHRLQADDDIVDPARAAEAFASQGAFAVGRDLYLGDEVVHWEESIKAIYYTSAGVVVRSGTSSDTNDGRSHYELVTPTGARSPVDVAMGDRIPGFEPDSSRFAYATQDSGRLEVVVHDVVSNRELARVVVLDHPVETGWEAPPVSIDGDVVWVRTGRGWTEVDWRTGATRAVPGTEDTYELQNGHYAVQRGSVWEVRAMSDQSLVGEVRTPEGWYAFFSPDGRLMRSFPDDVPDAEAVPSAFVHDVAAGSRFEHAHAGYDLGWTPDGNLLVLDGETVRVCEPLSDACTVRAFDDTGTVRLGGAPYES
jgi:hypothetical protein